MKIFKGFCGLVIFFCIVALVVPPMMFETEKLDMQTAILGIIAIALAAVLAFIGYIATERLGNRKIDFMEFIHEEYLGLEKPNKKRP